MLKEYLFQEKDYNLITIIRCGAPKPIGFNRIVGHNPNEYTFLSVSKYLIEHLILDSDI